MEEQEIRQVLEGLERDGYVQQVGDDRYVLTNNGIGYARSLIRREPVRAREFCRMILGAAVENATGRARLLRRVRRWANKRFSDEEFARILLGAVEYFDDFAAEVAAFLDEAARNAGQSRGAHEG